MSDLTSDRGTSPNAIPSVHVRDVAKRWDCHRNTVSNRAKLLKINLERSGYHDVYWPGEYLDLGDQMNAWVKSGNHAQAFWYVRQLNGGIQQSDMSQGDMPQSDMSQGAIEQSPKPSPGGSLGIATDIQQAPVQQIHTGAIHSPADLFAEEELILRLLRMPFGVPEEKFIEAFGERPASKDGTQREWRSGDILRPGVVVRTKPQPLRGVRFISLEEKEQEEKTKAKDSTALTIAPASPPRRMGFPLEETAQAVMDAIDVPFRTITGSSLFAANTIGR